MAAEWRLRDFSPQELANTLWAFATAEQSDTLPLAAWARAARRRVFEFKTQNLANTA